MALQNIKQIRGSTQGSVLFLGPNGIVSENNSQLYWDINNNALGVGGKLGVGPGKLNPVFDLDVYGTSSTTYLQVTDGATAGYILSSVDSIGNAVWVSPSSLVISGGSLIGATNGLTEITPGVVGLGGTLSQTTIIENDGYDFTIQGSGSILLLASYSSIQAYNGGYSEIQSAGWFANMYHQNGSGDTYQIITSTSGISFTLDNGYTQSNYFNIYSYNETIGDGSDNNRMVIFDGQNQKGLVYNDDYSTNFTTYSLITKGYVDSLIGSVGATNGLTEITPGVVGLGGTLSQNTSIDGNGYDLLLTNFSYLYFTSSIFDVESDFISLDAGTGSVQILADTDIIISSVDKLIFSGYSGLVNIGNTQGLVYDGDYTLGFITHSLVTKGYVDSISTGATNGLTNYGGYIGLGGTLSQYTSVDGGGYDLLLTNFDNLYFTSSVFDVESDFISLDAVDGSMQLVADQDILIFSTTGFITLSSNSGQVTTANLEGLVYTSDYSSTFVTQSLVTKGYVDSISTGATNGLTNYLGYIGLGGTLSQNTSIDGNGYDLLLTNFDSLYFTSSSFDVESEFISLDSGAGVMQLFAGDDIMIASSLGLISLTSDSAQVTTANLEGLVYTSDYSATFVTYSLVTKGYVDSISAGLSASGIVNYIPYWTSTNTLSSTSSIYDDGANVGIGTVSNPSYMVNVVGDVNITGTLYATSKSFEIEHPLDSNKRLVYGSLEGPEYGVYHRGKLNNEFVINLPDYWTELVDVDTISVNITPIGSHQRLFVEKIENNKVYIGSDNSGSPRCYYVVYAERKDIPKIIVEQ